MRDKILSAINSMIRRFYGERARQYDTVGEGWDRLLSGY